MYGGGFARALLHWHGPNQLYLQWVPASYMGQIVMVILINIHGYANDLLHKFTNTLNIKPHPRLEDAACMY